MNVEIMVYAYLLICLSMIIFNSVCVIVFRRRDRMLDKRSRRLEEKIETQLSRMSHGRRVRRSHMRYLRRKLLNAGNLLAFDEALSRLSASRERKMKRYLAEIYPVFDYLMEEYTYKDEVQLTFYLYILRRYKVLLSHPESPIHNVVLELIRRPSIYCRENALEVLYSGENADFVTEALQILDDSGVYHNAKLITDGLLTFAGDAEKLDEQLWNVFDRFSLGMRVALLNYFRFRSDVHQERMLALLKDAEQDDEIRFSCIRYFGKYANKEALPLLMQMADHRAQGRWEYAAIASSALAIYPSAQTAELLKNNLYSTFWHVRYNAAQSLEQMGFGDAEMTDVLQSEDRYAREMIRYRLEHRNGWKEEEQCRTA